jgi:hypothetical protein
MCLSVSLVGVGCITPFAFGFSQQEITFKTPSGNIRCDVWTTNGAPSGNAIQCAIMSSRVRVTYQCPDPQGSLGCPLVYSMDARSTVKIERGRWQVGASTTLGYNRVITVGWIRCSSAFSGLTCKSSLTGHGFFLSREATRTF